MLLNGGYKVGASSPSYDAFFPKSQGIHNITAVSSSPAKYFHPLGQLS